MIAIGSGDLDDVGLARTQTGDGITVVFQAADAVRPAASLLAPVNMVIGVLASAVPGDHEVVRGSRGAQVGDFQVEGGGAHDRRRCAADAAGIEGLDVYFIGGVSRQVQDLIASNISCRADFRLNQARVLIRAAALPPPEDLHMRCPARWLAPLNPDAAVPTRESLSVADSGAAIRGRCSSGRSGR